MSIKRILLAAVATSVLVVGFVPVAEAASSKPASASNDTIASAPRAGSVTPSSDRRSTGCNAGSPGTPPRGTSRGGERVVVVRTWIT